MSSLHRIALIAFLVFFFSPHVFLSTIDAQAQQLDPESDVDTVDIDSVEVDLPEADSLSDTLDVEVEPDTFYMEEMEELEAFPKKVFRHSLKAEIIAGVAVVVWLFFMFWAANIRQ